MLTNVFGKRGAGKTTIIRKALLKCRPPVVVLDVLGNFSEVEAYHAKNLADAVECIGNYRRAEIGGYLTDEISPIIVVQAHDPDEAANYLSSALLLAEGGTFILDEVDSISMALAPQFDYLIRYGRNFGVHVLTGCRRPAEISRNITAGANRIYIFQTQEPRDIEYFKKTLLGDQAESLISLEAYHGIFIDYDKKVIGTFRSDEKGNVYHLTETPIK